MDLSQPERPCSAGVCAEKGNRAGNTLVGTLQCWVYVRLSPKGGGIPLSLGRVSSCQALSKTPTAQSKHPCCFSSWVTATAARLQAVPAQCVKWELTILTRIIFLAEVHALLQLSYETPRGSGGLCRSCSSPGAFFHCL